MKKLFCLFMMVAMSISLVGCGEAKKETPKADPAKPATEPEKKM